MSEEIFRNKIIISSPESISIGYNSWFGLDTKLVGRIKALLKEYEDLQQKVEQLEKENKELKEENKRIFSKVNDDELLISNAMNYAELKEAEKKVEQLEERCEYLERSNNRREDEIIELRDENVDLVSKNNQLENIRKEATDFVNNNTYEYFHDGNLKDKALSINKTIFIDNLLNILNKGSEVN